MIPTVAPCTVPGSRRSINPSIRKLAGRLLGCTCVAALWLEGSVDDLWAHERYSYHLNQLEWGPQEATPAAQRDQGRVHRKRQHKTRGVHQKRGKVHQSGTQKSIAKMTRHRRPEAKNATKAAPVKSRTKTVEHRRQQTKTASRARGKSNFAKHHHSSTSKRIAGLIRAGSDRSRRTKADQNRQQHDEAAINHHAVPTSAEAAAIPMPSPRPTRPTQVNTAELVIPVSSAPEAADARRAEWGLVTYSASGPEDEIPQPLQLPDRATILERDRLCMYELPKQIKKQKT